MSEMAQLDGLTPRLLQTSRKAWWDIGFTRFLLETIPLNTRRIVEVDCGLAAAAHTLLPSLPDATYFGVDFDPQRLGEAKQELVGLPLAARIELRLAAASAVPLTDRSCDLFLSIMSLQHHDDVPAVLQEGLRLLQEKGRIVAIEPDNLGQRFYFDGGLEEISNEFHTLCLRARVVRQPADIALGPRLPKLLLEVGFHQVQMFCHHVNSTRFETAASFFSRLARIAQSIAEEGGLPPDSECLEACQQAIKRTLFSDMPKRLGYSCHLVPVFLACGRTPW